MPEGFEREVGDDLVGVHVGGGAGTALDKVGDELIRELARDDAVARRDDRIGDPGFKHAEFPVRHRRRFLDVAERAHEIGLPGHRYAGNAEVFLAAQRLDTVIGVFRYLTLAEKVSFGSCAHVFGLLSLIYARDQR